MNILYLTYGSQSGVIEHLSKAFTKKGVRLNIFDVSAAVSYKCKNFRLPSLKPSNLTNTFLSILQFKGEWRRHFKLTDFAFKKMTRYTERYIKKNHNKYDIILQAGAMFAPSFKPTPIPYVLYLDHTHKISENYPEIKGVRPPAHVSSAWTAMETDTYRNADLIFTMSNNAKKSLTRDYSIDAGKIIVAGAGPNIDNIPQNTVRRNGNNRILFVGEDFYRKGGEVLVNAFRPVKRDIPDSELVIVGCSPKITEPGVVVKGELSKDRLVEEYKRAALFVLPSLREPFGISFLEAMAYKLPCIGTDIEAIPEIIDNGRTGFIVPANDANALSEKMLMLLKDSGMRQSMGENGYKKVTERYTWDKVADTMIAALSGIKK